ncbi:shikimate dehydrogenase [SAR202 cluster bacterium AC-647-N09_OGT_505m]|nr:shikimate dehydrogenase [SAR202 cluster bacterium AC-647-N09_OGT_505m]
MTKRIFLIGHPLGHSVSPAFQQAALDYYGLDVRYEVMDVDVTSLPRVVAILRDMNQIGANVTVPHKEAIVALLDDLEEEAKLIGAVNTIENRRGVLVGHNTDAQGFLRALKEDAGFDPACRTALVLGAGGVARAVAMALAGAGVKSLVIANRTVERAKALVEDVRPLVPSAEAISLHPESLSIAAANSEVIVNCTSLGMMGGTGQGRTPIEAELVPSHALICDLVYNPQETQLLREASEAGARVLGGLPMLIYQGAASFELWTGKEAPVKVMLQVAEKALKFRQAAGE